MGVCHLLSSKRRRLLFFQAFEADGAHVSFLQLHVNQWELVFEAVADELDDVFFFGFGENVAGSGV